jgi:hypothetical protein
MRLWSCRALAPRLALLPPAAVCAAAASLAAAVLLPTAVAHASGPGRAAATAAAVQPDLVTPGGLVTVTVSCASPTTSAATLLGQPLGLPPFIAMNAAAREGDFVVTVRVSSGVRPARYHPRILCSDGTSTAAQLRVESARAAAAARAGAASARAAADAPTSPVNAGLAAGGVVLMAVGALAGGSALALRRRVRAHHP